MLEEAATPGVLSPVLSTLVAAFSATYEYREHVGEQMVLEKDTTSIFLYSTVTTGTLNRVITIIVIQLYYSS